MDYQRPSEEIASLVEVLPPPVLSLNPTNDWLLMMQPAGLPPIEDLAVPELRLAGIRINPRTHGKSRGSWYTSLILKNIKTRMEYSLKGIPNPVKFEGISWSPTGDRFSFFINTGNSMQLWICTVDDQQCQQVHGIQINDVLYGNSVAWLPDGSGLLCRVVPENKSSVPPLEEIPEGPVIMENSGVKAPVRTYQDLLRNKSDEKLFLYYAQSDLVRIDFNQSLQVLTGPAIISYFSISPDGQYLLLERVVEPFSYQVPYDRFTIETDLLKTDGSWVRRIAELPVAEDIPKGFSSVRKGPREFEWRADKPAELWWVEAADGGDANIPAEIRDILYRLSAPFTGDAQEMLPLSLRYEGVSWLNETMAIVDESWWENRRRITRMFQPEKEKSETKVLFDRSFEDSYSDPGYFLNRPNGKGKSILLSADEGKSLYLVGQGASPEGDRPFLDQLEVSTGEIRRLWRSEAPWYEFPYYVIHPQEHILITRRESVNEPPNFYLRNLKKNNLEPITSYPNPYPQIRNIRKELIHYKRADGLPLTGTLYLPYGDKEKNKDLPVLLWAYPQEFKSADAAGQVKDSPYRFVYISWASPLFWLVRGYAVLDDPSLPIIGEGDHEPNDSYIEQLVAGAKAAVDTLVERGIAHPKKIGIGGHSYGAFMTANLMAHSDLFAAGIARSGAYNRTLTPFGFQAEERTLWDAPETYMKMSPFMYADKIKKPLLIIHGEADNNSGTFPMQSERFFAALKGHGAITRLVLLPYESHGYKARESILHMLWEMDEWLRKYVDTAE